MKHSWFQAGYRVVWNALLFMTVSIDCTEPSNDAKLIQTERKLCQNTIWLLNESRL